MRKTSKRRAPCSASIGLSRLVYEQQLKMFMSRTHKVEDRILSIHESHGLILGGKARAKTEFGAKINLSRVDGFAFLDTLSWNAFNEGSHLKNYVEEYRNRFGFYPAKVLANQLYCTRENRKWLKLKEKNIKLAAKPLGRPSAKAVENHVRPGERNPIEGKFGQAKNAYGMNRTRTRLRNTSQSWIASILLVLNLIKLVRIDIAIRFAAYQQYQSSLSVPLILPSLVIKLLGFRFL